MQEITEVRVEPGEFGLPYQVQKYNGTEKVGRPARYTSKEDAEEAAKGTREYYNINDGYVCFEKDNGTFYEVPNAKVCVKDLDGKLTLVVVGGINTADLEQILVMQPTERGSRSPNLARWWKSMF